MPSWVNSVMLYKECLGLICHFRSDSWLSWIAHQIWYKYRHFGAHSLQAMFRQGKPTNWAAFQHQYFVIFYTYITCCYFLSNHFLTFLLVKCPKYINMLIFCFLTDNDICDKSKQNEFFKFNQSCSGIHADPDILGECAWTCVSYVFEASTWLQ